MVFGSEANGRLRLAIIGHIYVASHFVESLHTYPEVELIALCDPESDKPQGFFEKWKNRTAPGDNGTPPGDAMQVYGRLLENRPAVFTDYRAMLAELGDKLDAIVVSMYDHHHGPACSLALRSGKHVFCERPLGLTIHESRALRQLAEQHRRATSIRNPGNASIAFRRGVELVRRGLIGPVEQVHVWFNRGGPDFPKAPDQSQPVPPGLDWNAWLGPLPFRPYHPLWMSYALWRELANGGLGQFGPHTMNLAFSALEFRRLWDDPLAADAVIRVRAECNRINRVSFPKWEVVRWDVPARGDLPPVVVTWYNGPNHAPGAAEKMIAIIMEWGESREEAEKLLGFAGALLVGRDGALAADDHNANVVLLPRKRFADIKMDRLDDLPRSRGHYKDWLEACRGGPSPWADFSYAAPLSEFLKLGNVATQFDRTVAYRPSQGRFVDDEQCNKLLHYEYREGWTL